MSKGESLYPFKRTANTVGDGGDKVASQRPSCSWGDATEKPEVFTGGAG